MPGQKQDEKEFNMELKPLFEKLEQYGIFSQADYIEQAFSRNIGLFTKEEQDRLSHAKIGIPGMGGVGGIHFITMVRTGIGYFHISDFDEYEPGNINRQFGARVPDFGRPKLEVMKEQALSVNPFIKIKEFPEGISKETVDDFLEGLNVVLDSLDFFAFDTRRLLFTRAREKGVHVVTAGPLGFSSAMLIFAPDKGMGFDEYFNIMEDMKPEEQHLAFALGLAPKAVQFKYMDMGKLSFKSGKGPSLNIACQLCSAMAGTEAVRIILKRKGVKPVPHYIQFDPFVRKYYKRKLIGGNRNFLQKLKFKIVRNMQGKHEPVLPPRIPEKPDQAAADRSPDRLVLTDEAKTYLLEMGILAPSADNCQCWLFSWEGSDLIIESDPQRTHFFYDINQESTLITIGAVMENIAIAAGDLGLETVPEPVSLSDNGEVSVRIKFKPAENTRDTLAEFIPVRCINRKPYTKQGIDKKTIQEMNRIFQDSANIGMTWVQTQADQKRLREIVYLSDRVLFEEKRLHQGLFKFIHMGDEPFPTDGMNLGVLELSWMQKKIFPLFSQWKYQEMMNKFMISRAMAFNSVTLLKKTPVYGVLTLNDRSSQGYVEAGRKMERFWITANSLGLAVQPMAGFVFLINHFYHNQAGFFKPEHRKMIQKIKQEFDLVTARAAGNNWAPVMFFRIGYALPQKKRTGRRPLGDVLKHFE